MEQGFIIDFVSWLFSEVIPYIMFTPFEFFKSASALSVLSKMGLFSAGLVTILAMLEGVKRTMSMKYTPLSQILVRYPVAIVVSAAAPFIFYYSGVATNALVKFMGVLTNSSLDGTDHFASMFQGVTEHVLESFLMFFFLIVMGFYLFKIVLYHAGRWFGLLFNMVTTPLVMTAYMFKSYEKVAYGWFKDTVQKFLVVVVHSFFLGLIGILLYSPTTEYVRDEFGVFNYLVVKILFAIGGLQMMLKPPKWLPTWIETGDDFNTTRKAFRPVKAVLKKMNYTFPKGGK